MATESVAEAMAVVKEAPRRVLRNGLRTRLLHAAVFLTAAFLLFTGVAIMGEGIASLQDLLGGHVAAGRWHRQVGLGLVITLVLFLPLLRPRAVVTFLWESIRFRWLDLRWLLSWPLFVAGFRRRLPRHEGHFDPGQRVLNLAFLAAFMVLSLTGVLMAYPDRFQPEVFAWSLRIHRIATWAFVALAAAHIFVALGVLPAYRGVWRAMLGSGWVDRRLAQRLWPRWVEREEATEASHEGRRSNRIDTEIDGRYAPNPTNRPLRADHSDTPG